MPFFDSELENKNELIRSVRKQALTTARQQLSQAKTLEVSDAQFIVADFVAEKFMYSFDPSSRLDRQKAAEVATHIMFESGIPLGMEDTAELNQVKTLLAAANSNLTAHTSELGPIPNFDAAIKVTDHFLSQFTPR